MNEESFPTGLQARSTATFIAVASFLTLFLELALIRWVSCEIRIFAYFKNLVLIACFLGFGTGCFFSQRRINFSNAVLLLLLLALLIQLPFQPLKEYGPEKISHILAKMPGLMIYRASEAAVTWGNLPALSFAIAWTVVLFFLIALIFFPFGQIVGASMAALGKPLRAYSINVLGSLAGILSYTLVTSIGLPPLCWFVPVALGCAWLVRENLRTQILMVSVALLLVLLPNNTPGDRTYWSSYQKLQVIGSRVYVNKIGYQGIWSQPDFDRGPVEVNGTTMPYLVRRPAGRVLIIGAGAGNDAAAALKAGATAVTAVEIDGTILEIGRKMHPQKPYSDPKVRTVLDDARHFLQTNHDQFDLIVFSHLDSHTVLSSFTNVRLDDYIYTVESLRQARERLAPGGIVYLVFWSEQPYVVARLARNLWEAFGHAPFLSVREGRSSSANVHLAFFFTGEPGVMPGLRSALGHVPDQFGQLQKEPDIVPSRDDWPFLPLSHPHIPVLVKLLSLLILLLCAAFTWKLRPRGESFQGTMFWLGAAFLLVEVHNVSRLALVFGVTWQVNAWVIGAILSVVLLANWLTARMRAGGIRLRRWIYAGLFVSLAAAYLAPVHLFLGLPYWVGGATATFILTLPIFFAAMVFAEIFAESENPAFALGWNILGAAVGGMTEAFSYLFGIPGLVLIAALFYACALAWQSLPRRRAAMAGDQPQR